MDLTKTMLPYLISNIPTFDDTYDLPPPPKKFKGYVVKPVRDSKDEPKINRNDFCPCGSGLKYKKCCL
jgi:uncharacterized protein YecA (UPF0149 family)